RRHTRSKRDWSSDVCSSDLSLDSPGFATAMTITHTRVQTALHTPERIKGKVFQAVRDAGFSSSDGHLWTMHESWTHADRTYRLRSEERRVGKECSAQR